MILLDTHALVWLDAGEAALGIQAQQQIDTAFRDRQLFVSAISYWETGMLIEKGRLALELDAEDWRAQLIGAGLQELSVTGIIGLKAARLDRFHGDPADRLIVATALAHDLRLVTADQAILDWSPQLQVFDARR